MVSINKNFCPPEQAVISIFDHGFLFGDSVYEVIRTYGGVPFALQRHLMRLVYSASRLCLPLPYPIKEIAAEVIRGTRMRESGESKIRIIVTRGIGEMSLTIRGCRQQSMIVVFSPYTPLPDHYYSKGVKVALTNVQRHATGILPQIKSGNYINNVLALMDADRQDAFEGVMLNAGGDVCECTTSSIFLVRGKRLVTPHLMSGILDGITRKLVVEIAGELGIAVAERTVAREELLSAEEVFLTSTLKGIVPVNRVDSGSVPAPGPVTLAVMSAFARRIENFRAEYPDLGILEQKLESLS